MAPNERDVALYDADRVLRHQHSSSSSDHGRSSYIPMWDSSDPERAPPPLPLNPQSPSVGVGTSRPGTSTAIQNAHAALNEKARESSLMSNVLSKRMADASPERTPRASVSYASSISSSSISSNPSSASRSQSHRRMQSLQSLQSGSVRDLSLMLDGNGRDSSSSTPRSPEKALRPTTPYKSHNHNDHDPFVDERPNPGPGPSLTPIVRPIVRRPQQQSILGQNTPPQSATMVALHNMATSSPTPRELPIPPISQQPAPQPSALHVPTPPTAQPEHGPVPPPPVASSTTNSSAGGAASGRSTYASTGDVAFTRQPTVAVENLSKQILSLTSIATSLQKEMAALSRRSRDNATDLMSLKEATNARDEDIRKSLREIITTSEGASVRSRDSYTSGPFLIDNKPHHIHQSTTSPLLKQARPFSLPRIPSPNSFAASLDRESMSTPSLCGNDGPNTIAMLERIMREMGTKEGQEMLLKRLVDVIDKLTGMASATKLEDLVQFVKERQERQERQAPAPQSVASSSSAFDMGDNASSPPSRPRNYSFDHSSASEFEIEYSRNSKAQRAGSHRTGQRRSSAPIVGTADVISDDVLRIIKTVKDSVAQGGGLTAEVKALVRELRGEVLGMGREIGRRLDEVETTAREEGKPAAATQDEMARVVDEGLSEMKQHMNNLMREHRRQSAAETADVAAAAAKAVPGVDYEEVYNAMRAALKDARASKPSKQELSREDVIEAVKDAWEMYKPEIEIQQIGLERDEVLACLEQGLREYAPHDDKPAGATRDEVFKAVVEGMKHFVPPQMPPPGISRDEVLGAVRECLEEFEFPVAPSAIGAEMTREDMVEAVKQGLDGFDLPRSSDRELVALRPPPQNNNDDDEIITRLDEIVQLLREEFKAVSDEAKQNIAASGRDTEQVLDATRDGLEKLRGDLEGYVDKVAAAVSHQDLSEGLIRTLDVFRNEISELMSKATEDSKDLLKDEIDSLRDAVNSSLVPALPNASAAPANREVLEALQEGVNCLRGEISTRHVNSTSEVLDAIQEGLQDLRVSIDKLSNKPTDFSANDEILDALKSGLSDVRTDIDGLRDQNSTAVTTFDSSNAIVPADMLRHDDIKNLESLITQLRSKVDVLDAAQIKLSSESDDSESQASSSRGVEEDPVWKEKLAQMESKLHAIHESVTGLCNRDMDIKLPEMESKLDAIQESVAGLASREPVTAAANAANAADAADTADAAANAADAPLRPSTDAASREDVEAIETILRNTKARLDDLIDGEQFVRREHIDSIEAVVLETKDSLTDLKDLMAGLSSREDISMVESLVAQVASGFDEMKDRHEKHLADPEKVTKTDVDAVALACLQVKSAVEKMAQADEETGLPSKDDLLALSVIVRDVRDQLEMVSAAQTKATEDQQAEIVGVGERISDVKAFLEVLNETVKGRLEDGVLGMESVGKILDSLSDTIGRNSSDLHDLYETMKNEFEESRAGVVGVKLESDERLQQTTETLGAKIDERINALMAKFDEFYAAADDKARIGEERDVEVEAAVVGTKAVAEELKLLVDTLGSAVTDSLEKMEEASKTVFTRVDDMVTKAEDNHTDAKAEHEQTREQVQEALAAVQQVQGHVTEYHPQILDTVKDVLLVVNDHFEHHKTAVVTMQQEIIDSIPRPPTPPPVEKYDDALVHEKLDKLVGQTDRAAEAYDKLDKMDALVDHTLAVDAALSKIDRLVEHCDDTDKALVQLEKLDQLEKLEKLDYLIAQSDSTTETLTKLEKLEKLDQLEKLDYLVAQSESTTETLTNLEKLDQLEKLDYLVAQSESTTETLAKLEQLEKLDYLVVQSDSTTETLTQLAKLDQLEKLEKLDYLVAQSASTTETLAKLDKLDELEKLDYLIAQSESTTETLTNLEKLNKLDQLIDLSQLAGRAFDAQHSKIDKLVDHTQVATDAYAKLESLERLGELDKLEKLDYLVDQAEVTTQALVRLDDLDKLDQLQQLEKLNQMEQLDQLGQLQQLERLSQLDQLEQLQQLQQLEKLEKLEKLEELEKLDYLVEQSETTTQALVGLDKLDELVDSSRSMDDKADKALSQLETLEKVHEQVMRTASDLAQYMATQTQRIADDHEDREKTLRETSITLERRQAEIVQVDANLDGLREEERRLKESVASLRADQEAMQRNKIRLAADVSSLETALHLRREELHEMEARAEGLERRILEGVMDHSRILLMAKANKGREAMSRKRVVPSKKDKKDKKDKESLSAADPATRGTRGVAAENKPRAAFNLAMSTKRNAMPANSPGGVAANGSANGSRRILSLSQINSSSSTGSIRRSNSVRANVSGAGGLRKSSWGGRVPTKGYDALEVDKENVPLQESDEEDNGDSREAGIDDSHEDYDTLNEQVSMNAAGDDALQDCGADDEHDEVGTAVVASATQSESGEFYSGDEDDDASSAEPQSESGPGEVVV